MIQMLIVVVFIGSFLVGCKIEEPVHTVIQKDTPWSEYVNNAINPMEGKARIKEEWLMPDGSRKIFVEKLDYKSEVTKVIPVEVK